MTEIQRGFFEGEGAQLLAEIKQEHDELIQIGQQWIDKVYRVAAKVQEAWERGRKRHYKLKAHFYQSLEIMSGIDERTLQFYCQVLENKPVIEAARAKGQIINKRTVQLLICKPKKEKPSDGWIEKNGAFSKTFPSGRLYVASVVVVGKDGIAEIRRWLLEGEKGQIGTLPTLQEAKDHATRLETGQQPSAIPHVADLEAQGGDNSDPNGDEAEEPSPQKPIVLKSASPISAEAAAHMAETADEAPFPTAEDDLGESDSDPNDEENEEQTPQEAAHVPTEKPTKFGQEILDIICGHVETAPQRGQTGCHGHFGWSIGKTSEVVAYVAEQLKKPVKSVAGGVSDLIEKSFLSSDLSDDQGGYDVHDEVAISHKGWLAYSQWSAPKMMHDMGMESLEHWKEWDGVDGTFYPYNNCPAFGKAQMPNGTPAQPSIKATDEPEQEPARIAPPPLVTIPPPAAVETQDAEIENDANSGSSQEGSSQTQGILINTAVPTYLVEKRNDDSQGKPWRVCIGTFATEQEAEAAARKHLKAAQNQQETTQRFVKATSDGTATCVTFHGCHNIEIDSNSLQCIDEQGQTVILIGDLLQDGLGASGNLGSTSQKKPKVEHAKKKPQAKKRGTTK